MIIENARRTEGVGKSALGHDIAAVETQKISVSWVRIRDNPDWHRVIVGKSNRIPAVHAQISWAEDPPAVKHGVSAWRPAVLMAVCGCRGGILIISIATEIKDRQRHQDQKKQNQNPT